MISVVQPSHNVFRSEAYRRDRVPFDGMERIRQMPARLETNGDTFAVAMGVPQFPAWVWTADDVSDRDISGLCRHLYARFGRGRGASFMAKPPVANRIAAFFAQKCRAQARFLHMESYDCPCVIPARNSRACPEKPQRGDLERVADCCRQFYIDCFGRELEYDACLREAARFVSKPGSFIIRQGETVAAMAGSTGETGKYVVVHGVYTRPEFRRQGFAAALTAHISRLILAQGRIPLLYADLVNAYACRAYRSVGFVPRGRVTRVDLTWKR